MESKEAEKKRMKGELLAQLDDAETQLTGAREVRNAAEPRRTLTLTLSLTPTLTPTLALTPALT